MTEGSPMLALSETTRGQRVRVVQIAGDDSLSIRLMEMGLTPGVDVVLVGAAPLGDPLEFEVRGYRLSLRRSEAARVSVEPL
jgi:ferrous iron transport protein A